MRKELREGQLHNLHASRNLIRALISRMKSRDEAVHGQAGGGGGGIKKKYLKNWVCSPTRKRQY
jgi:hypothetical protein